MIETIAFRNGTSRIFRLTRKTKSERTTKRWFRVNLSFPGQLISARKTTRHWSKKTRRKTSSYRVTRCLAFNAVDFTFSFRSFVTTLLVVGTVALFFTLAVVVVSFFLLLAAAASFVSFFGAISWSKSRKRKAMQIFESNSIQQSNAEKRTKLFIRLD